MPKHGDVPRDARFDRSGQDAVEGRTGTGEAEQGGAGQPAAGPHATPDLTEEEATPGAGTLTPAGGENGTDSASS